MKLQFTSAADAWSRSMDNRHKMEKICLQYVLQIEEGISQQCELGFTEYTTGDIECPSAVGTEIFAALDRHGFRVEQVMPTSVRAFKLKISWGQYQLKD